MRPRVRRNLTGRAFRSPSAPQTPRQAWSALSSPRTEVPEPVVGLTGELLIRCLRLHHHVLVGHQSGARVTQFDAAVDTDVNHAVVPLVTHLGLCGPTLSELSKGGRARHGDPAQPQVRLSEWMMSLARQSSRTFRIQPLGRLPRKGGEHAARTVSSARRNHRWA
jgi:hypothetical protein